MKVPFHRPSLGTEEIEAVNLTLASGWLTTGPRTAEFEQEFKDYVGVPNALAVNSCTAGLHLALAALGLGPGDEVITTPLTFCATVNVIMHTGATPVLADIGPDGNIDPESIASRITNRTRALLPVHYAGLPCKMDDIWSLARDRGLYVVEDCAHSLGATYHGAQTGSSPLPEGRGSDAAAYSFYATKNITTGEGGMVVTPHSAIADKMKVLCLHGISRDAWNRYSDKGNWYYEVGEPGFKYNMSDIQSAIGIEQLRKLERFTECRERHVKLYDKLLGGVEHFELPPRNDESRHAWHIYALRLNLDRLRIDRAEFMDQLRERGIGASVHFIPIPMHPFFREHADLPHNACPEAMALYPRLISLPLFPSMTEEEVTYVAESVKAIAAEHSKSRTVAMDAVV
ncbi:MAG TPA: DegT/DnrJ/EryC1/StrS family aminotransferase [Bryobacteraceae bacterium]|nr:DegT/DnrJ/EryC1/StrS family aminotransferase [Bryobacteraceae bacterium]HPT28394.1 DegT/DnrJ/EryC1/StrS family aminotransferase [Bryobacteraceae bacterium]